MAFQYFKIVWHFQLFNQILEFCYFCSLFGQHEAAVCRQIMTDRSLLLLLRTGPAFIWSQLRSLQRLSAVTYIQRPIFSRLYSDCPKAICWVHAYLSGQKIMCQKCYTKGKQCIKQIFFSLTDSRLKSKFMRSFRLWDNVYFFNSRYTHFFIIFSIFKEMLGLTNLTRICRRLSVYDQYLPLLVARHVALSTSEDTGDQDLCGNLEATPL